MKSINWETNKQKVLTRWELESEKCSKTFFKVIERQNMQNQSISELYTNDNKSKISSNLQDIVKSANNYYEKIYTKEATSNDSTSKLFSKIPNRRKMSNEQCNLCEARISLDEIVKSINSQTNNNL